MDGDVFIIANVVIHHGVETEVVRDVARQIVEVAVEDIGAVLLRGLTMVGDCGDGRGGGVGQWWQRPIRGHLE